MGLCGFTDPDNRRTYPWGKEDRELFEFHKEMIRIHKEERPLRKGSIKLLLADYNILAYARFQEDEQIVVVLNNKGIKTGDDSGLAFRSAQRGKDETADLLL